MEDTSTPRDQQADRGLERGGASGGADSTASRAATDGDDAATAHRTKSSARLKKSIQLQPMQRLNSNANANELFYLACQAGDVAIVQSQLDLGSNGALDVNQFTHHQDTPLCVACVEERLDIVALLLAHPAIQVNLCNYSHPPLALAAGLGRAEVVRLLLGHPSIDVNVATARRTPLTAACENGHLDVVKLLCARPDLQLNLLDDDEHSALFSACLHGNSDVVRFLLSLPNIDVNLLCCGDLAVTVATLYHHKDVVEMLVAHPSLDVNKLDQDGVSALAHACFEEFDDIVSLLLKHSAIQPFAGTKSAFTRTVEKGHAGILDLLLAHTPLTNTVLSSGELPLALLACQRGQLDVVKLFFSKGLFQNDPPEIQRQAVYQALANKRVKMSRFLLLDNFTKLSLAPTPTGEATLLHAAAALGNEAIVTALLGRHIEDVAALDGSQQLALHVAATEGHWEAAILLLSADLPIDVANGQVVPRPSHGPSWTAFADPSGPFSIVDEPNRCDVVRAVVLQFPESKQPEVAQALLAAVHPSSYQPVGSYIDTASLNFLNLWAKSTPAANEDGSDTEEDPAGGGDGATEGTIDAAFTVPFPTPSRPPGTSSDAGSPDRTKSSARLKKSIMLQPMQRLNSNVNANELFYLACQAGDITMVQSQLPLASSGSLDLNRFTHHQDTPLCVACVEERLDIVALLLSHPSIQVNLCNYSHPPLALAAGLGRIEVVRLLLSHPSIDVNVSTARRTPLTAACENGHLDVVKLLCARPDLKLNLLDDDEHTALFTASLHGHTDVVRFLLTLPGLDVNLLCSGDLALTIATLYHHKDIVDMLLAVPSLDVNNLDQDGQSALAHACQEGFDDIASALLKHPATQLRTGTKSAFTRAVEKGHSKVLDVLLAHEPLTNTVQSPTELALATVACQRGHLDIVKLFIARGMFQNDPPDVQRISMYEAVANKRIKVARLLLDTKDVAWTPTPKGQSTLLHAAALGGNEAVVTALLARNIEAIGALDTNDQTALQVAVHEGNWGAAALLLGADLPVEVTKDDQVVPRPSYDNSWTDFADPSGVYSVVDESKRCDVLRALMLQFPEAKQGDVSLALLATTNAATGRSVASYIDKKSLDLLNTWAPSPPVTTDLKASESRRPVRTPGAVSVGRIETGDAGDA